MVSIFQTRDEKTVLIPENKEKQGSLITFLFRQYINDPDLKSNDIQTILKDADTIIITTNKQKAKGILQRMAKNMLFLQDKED